MKTILLFMLLLSSGPALADTNSPDNLNKLESTLTAVRQEQQTVYQNYQMTKELRLTEVQDGYTNTYGISINTPPPNYDDIVREQLEREKRIQQYTDDLKRLSVRYLELEDQRKTLLNQMKAQAQHLDE